MNAARAVIFCVCLCASAAGVCAGEPGQQVAESAYFTVYADRATDAYTILSKLDFNYLAHANTAAQGDTGVQQELARSLDGLYAEVSDILDIHIYSYHGKIVVLADQPALQALAKQKFGVDFNERSVYWHEQNTIYISLVDLTAGMLGHEMAHAIISHYFIVPPPVTIQEVLSGYVEYQLRKQRG